MTSFTLSWYRMTLTDCVVVGVDRNEYVPFLLHCVLLCWLCEQSYAGDYGSLPVDSTRKNQSSLGADLATE